MRIFIGPTEIAGIGTALCNGFHKIGVEAELILREAHRFGYDINLQQLWLLRMWRRLRTVNISLSRKQPLKKLIALFAFNFSSFMVLIWSLRKFDVYIFLFGETITNTAFELWLMRTLRKRIIFLYLGSDARPPYINGALFPDGSSIDLDKVKTMTARCKRRLQLEEKYAIACINSPATAHFHKKPFINWFAIGLPRNFIYCPSHGTNCQMGQKIRILHCPSLPVAKGSATILSAMDRLREKGYPIEAVMLENVPNSKVFEELAHCDFVVDQLYSDTPMATFATEAAHFGKPAVVGGYFASFMASYVSNENIPPSLFVHPDEIEVAVERLVTDVSFRLELGRGAFKFVKTRWASKSIAVRFMRIIDGDIPQDWWFDPQKIRYVHGGGLSEQNARRIVRDMIECYGRGSLQLADKPRLEKAFLRFALMPDEKTKK